MKIKIIYFMILVGMPLLSSFAAAGDIDSEQVITESWDLYRQAQR